MVKKRHPSGRVTAKYANEFRNGLFAYFALFAVEYLAAAMQPGWKQGRAGSPLPAAVEMRAFGFTTTARTE